MLISDIPYLEYCSPNCGYAMNVVVGAIDMWMASVAFDHPMWGYFAIMSCCHPNFCWLLKILCSSSYVVLGAILVGASHPIYSL